MSGCACLYVEGCDEIILLRQTILTAAKEHQCFSCERPIRRGEKFHFEQSRNMDTGSIYTHKLCLGCSQLIPLFFCESYYYHVVDSLVDHLCESGESICCYDGLKPAAQEVMEEVIWPLLEKTEAAHA